MYVTDGAELGIISPQVTRWVVVPDEYDSPNHLDDPKLTEQITLDGTVRAVEIDNFGNIIEPLD